MKDNFNGQILLPEENKVKNATVFLMAMEQTQKILLISVKSGKKNCHTQLSFLQMPLLIVNGEKMHINGLTSRQLPLKKSVKV